MLGGIKIVRDSSRHNIEKKLKELEEQKNQGNITLDEYDTLRIRYERKLGNKETVSKLQESKGFKPSFIKEKKAKKEALYDDFVDKYSKSEGKDYGQIQRDNMFSGTTIRAVVILFLLLAFGIGIIAGITAINNNQAEIVSNITISDSAFSADSTNLNSSNLTQDTSNITYNNTKYTKKSSKKYSSKNSSSSSYSSSSSSKKSSYSSGSSSSGSSSNSRSSYSGSSGSGSNSRSSSSYN